MIKTFLMKLKESTISVLPFVAIILLLGLTITPLSTTSIVGLLFCSFFIIIGMSLFSIGADLAMLKMGGYIGSNLSKSRRFFLMLLCSLVIGFVITVAEPDLAILVSQFPYFNSVTCIACIGIGVGVFLLIALVRIIFRVRISVIIAISYALIFILMFFVPSELLPFAFDTSGVTTGPISVPFIMAFGLGIVAVRSSKSNEEDGFGLIGLASIGPIITILILAIFSSNSVVTLDLELLTEFVSYQQLFSAFGFYFLQFLLDVAIILLPICALFLVFQITTLKYPKQVLLRLFVGICFTYVGIVLFLTGVNAGFLQIGTTLGSKLASLGYNWVLIPIGAIIGFSIVASEPAVHILNEQIESLTSGLIKKRTIMLALMVGVSIAVSICVIRALYSVNILFFIIPILSISILLSFYNDSLFTAIAFDSGGVASGSMTTAFLLPFINGVCFVVGGYNSVLYNGFGTIAIVASMPIFVVQIMGAIFTFNKNKQKKLDRKKMRSEVKIIEYDL